jgi:hypothetical protein
MTIVLNGNLKNAINITHLLHIYLWFVVDVIVWELDLQLPMQSVPITTDVASSNFDQGEVYNIM